MAWHGGKQEISFLSFAHMTTGDSKTMKLEKDRLRKESVMLNLGGILAVVCEKEEGGKESWTWVMGSCMQT